MDQFKCAKCNAHCIVTVPKKSQHSDKKKPDECVYSIVSFRTNKTIAVWKKVPPQNCIKTELCDEDILHLKSLLEDKAIMKIAFDKQDVWPFTVQEIIKSAEHVSKESTAKNVEKLLVELKAGENSHTRMRMEQAWKAATKATEARCRALNKTTESNEPCDYCVDKHHPNCSNGRTEYFPACFKGQKLQHS